MIKPPILSGLAFVLLISFASRPVAAQDQSTSTASVTLSGQVTDGKKPLARALVKAISNVYNGKGWVRTERSTITDSNGQYHLQTIPGGIYISAKLGDEPNWLASLPLPLIRAKAGGEIKSLDMVLVKPVNISGQIFVQGSNEQPRGLRMSVEPIDPFSNNERRGDTIADQGNFSFYALPGEMQWMRVYGTARGIGSKPVDFYYLAKPDNNPPITLKIPPEMVLPPIHILGVVRDVLGAAAPLAKVALLDDSGETVSDQEGQFNFEFPLYPSEKLVAISPNGLVSRPFTLSENADITLNLKPEQGSLQGRVVDQATAPVTGTEVTLYMGEFNGNHSLRLITHKTDFNGEYRFDQLPVDGVTYWASAGGYPYSPGSIDPINLVKGKPIHVADIRLKESNSNVTGVVIDAQGKPVATMIHCFQRPGFDYPSQSDGHFCACNLPQGDVDLYCNWLGESHAVFHAKENQKDLVVQMRDPITPYANSHPEMNGLMLPALHQGDWLSDKTVALESLRGKVTVIAFWSEYSRQNSKLLANLEDLSRRFRDIAFLGIHMPGMPIEIARKTISDIHITFPNQMDEDQHGFNSENFIDAFAGRIYVVGPDGRIACDTYDVSDAEAAIKAFSLL